MDARIRLLDGFLFSKPTIYMYMYIYIYLPTLYKQRSRSSSPSNLADATLIAVLVVVVVLLVVVLVVLLFTPQHSLLRRAREQDTKRCLSLVVNSPRNGTHTPRNFTRLARGKSPTHAPSIAPLIGNRTSRPLPI